MNTNDPRPALQRSPSRPLALVWAVLRRELGAKLFSSGYIWSTASFAAVALFTPLLLSDTGSVASAAVAKMSVLLGLGFGLVIVIVVILWGTTLSADVVQEKSSRVVEVILATIRPWQLLSGKVAAITIIGIVQMLLVAVAAFTGMYVFSHGLNLTLFSAPVVVAGGISLLVGVPSLSALLAAMSARVDHQEDLGAATQPVYLLLMAPFAAAVFAGLYAPTGIALHLLSLAPLTNVFAMPARLAVAPVPAWELLLSLSIALATLVAAIWLAGRIYSGSVLRAGTTVSLREALTRQ